MRRTVAIDLETHLIEPGCLAPRPVVISIAENGKSRLSKDWRGEAIRLLLRRDTIIVGHNVAFDLGCIYQHAPETRRLIWQAYDSGRISDTGLRDRILLLADGRRTIDDTSKWASTPQGQGQAVRPSFSLAEAVKRNLRDAAAWSWWFDEKHTAPVSTDTDSEEGSSMALPDSGGWRLRYAELEGVALSDWPESATRYAEADSLLTLRVWEAQQAVAPSYCDSDCPDLLRNEPDQCRAAWALHLVSGWGMITDAERVEQYDNQWNGLLGGLQQRLVQTGILKSKVSRSSITYTKDTKTIQELVERSLTAKGKEVPRTNSGRVSMEREVLEDTGDPGLLLLAEHTKLEKLIGTYLPVLKKGSVAPLHTRYEVLLETGRTSSSGPNIQNLPRDSFFRDYATNNRVGLSVREAFVARPGFAYISVDYDTLELRTLAEVAHQVSGNRSVLARVLNEGLDPHLDLAALMLGIPYEEAQTLHKADDPRVSQMRTTAKVGNFGFPGGLGQDAFVEYARANSGGELRLTATKAREIKQYWMQKWPEMKAYFQYVENHRVSDGSYSLTLPGSGLNRKNCTYTSACNCFFQSQAAHGAKRALYRVVRACFNDPDSPLYRCRAVAFIHDEVILEAPKDMVHEAGEEQARLMCEAMQEVVPNVRITASPAAMLRWYKKAKAVYRNGRLVPWEPKE